MQSDNVNGLMINTNVKKVQQQPHSNRARQNKWRGYAILLESSDVIQTPLFEQNPIIDSSRSRRSTATTMQQKSKS